MKPHLDKGSYNFLILIWLNKEISWKTRSFFDCIMIRTMNLWEIFFFICVCVCEYKFISSSRYVALNGYKLACISYYVMK